MANLFNYTRILKDSHHYTVVAPAGIKNGNVLVLGTRNSDDTYEAAAPVAITDFGMVLVTAVPLSYEAGKAKNDYVIATGDEIRTIVMKKGDKIDFVTANIETTITPDNTKFVVPVAGTSEMKVVNALGGTEELAFKVERVYTKTGIEMVELRCLKA